jgi:maleamate amidohydrolase
MTKDLDLDYRTAGFTGRLEWGHSPALVVVDFCMAYLDPSSPLYAGVEDARDCAARLLSEARAARLPIFHTTVRFMPGGADGGIFFRKVPLLRAFEAGSPLAEPPPELAPREGEFIVVKQYASAFFGTSFAATLTSRGIDTLAIAGVSTSGCIRATAVDACQHGFLPFVCRDAVGDRHPGPHEANLFDLAAKYAEVVDESFVQSRFRAAAGRNN